jgi:hypothetical protein
MFTRTGQVLGVEDCGLGSAIVDSHFFG